MQINTQDTARSSRPTQHAKYKQYARGSTRCTAQICSTLPRRDSIQYTVGSAVAQQSVLRILYTALSLGTQYRLDTAQFKSQLHKYEYVPPRAIHSQVDCDLLQDVVSRSMGTYHRMQSTRRQHKIHSTVPTLKFLFYRFKDKISLKMFVKFTLP